MQSEAIHQKEEEGGGKKQGKMEVSRRDLQMAWFYLLKRKAYIPLSKKIQGNMVGLLKSGLMM